MDLPTFTPGQELAAADLNALGAAARAAGLSVSGSGMRSVGLPSGSAFRFDRRPECWVKITGGGTSAFYDGTEQIEQPGGTWANGPRTFAAADQRLKEVNGNSTLGSGNIYRAYRDGKVWYFVCAVC